MDYIEALNYINDKNKFGSRPGLIVIGKLLELLGSPHLDMKYIHVAGTNGKGSTSAYIASMLKEAGYRVGLFTSPYIERFNDRISINGQDIPDRELGRLTARIKEQIEIMLKEGYDHPTTFEIVTTIAFLYFKEEDTDFVVLEVGLGGRADSTNVIMDSCVSVLTTIAYDHTEVLGNTIGDIAYEKAGIIKDGGFVISYPQEKKALEVINRVVADKKAGLKICPMDKIDIIELNEFGAVFTLGYNNESYENLRIGLLGKHQVYNANLALLTVTSLRDRGILEISKDQIRDGLRKTEWRGRLEILGREPTFLVDGAHNLQGIRTLAESIGRFKYNRLILGLGILKDKDVEKMVEAIAYLAHEIVVTEVKMPRKLEAGVLGDLVSKYNKNIHIEKDIEKAIGTSYELAAKDDMIVFGGSLYLISDVRNIILKRN